MALGKLTARDRITALLDVDSFYEFDLFVEHRCRDFDMDKKVLPGDGVITGTGSIMGYPVCIYAQDFTVAGGSLGLMHARKITKIMDHAIKMGMPIIGINDSGGARIQEGVDSLAGYGEIFYRNTLASGIVPQISVILGPCAGGAVYSPALTDFVFVVDKISKMFITGPEVIKTVLGEEISMEDLGGARVHSEISGNANFYARNELECFHKIKQLFTFIPWNNRKKGGTVPGQAAEGEIRHRADRPDGLPETVRREERHLRTLRQLRVPRRACQLGGEPRGRLCPDRRRDCGDRREPADGPGGGAGCRFLGQGGRFIRFCDAFGIPLITFVDLPGYLPGVDQEHAGVIRHGAKLLYAFSEATVPKITVILRKAYGGGYIAMCSRHLGCGLCRRLADGGDRGHGSRRERRTSFSRTRSPARPIPPRCAAEGGGVYREIREPVRRRRLGAHRCGDQPRRDTGFSHPRDTDLGQQERVPALQETRHSSLLTTMQTPETLRELVIGGVTYETRFTTKVRTARAVRRAGPAPYPVRDPRRHTVRCRAEGFAGQERRSSPGP
jgi:hypothetical protein